MPAEGQKVGKTVTPPGRDYKGGKELIQQGGLSSCKYHFVLKV